VVEIVIRFTSSHDHVRGCITLAQCYSRAAFHPFLPTKKQKIVTDIYAVNHDQACNKFENETHGVNTHRQFRAFLDALAVCNPAFPELLAIRVLRSPFLAEHWRSRMAIGALRRCSQRPFWRQTYQRRLPLHAYVSCDPIPFGPVFDLKNAAPLGTHPYAFFCHLLLRRHLVLCSQRI